MHDLHKTNPQKCSAALCFYDLQAGVEYMRITPPPPLSGYGR
jgi:hypothetical protein